MDSNTKYTREGRQLTALTVTDAGGFMFKRQDGTQGSANFPLFLIRAAWDQGADFEGFADGFGAGAGTKGDWSAIRDSTEPAIAGMLLKAINFLGLSS